MTPEDQEQYRKPLQAVLSRIESELADMTSELKSGEYAVGETDPTNRTSREADFVIEHVDEALLHQTRAALDRLDQGTFGTCVDCGGPIARARLNVVPHSPVCIGCERIRESRDR